MRSLDAICETFAPGAVQQGVPAAVLDSIEHDLTFPTASGVNPMITIEAIAHLNARKLAARLT